MRRARFGPITAARCERLERRALLAVVSGHVLSDANVNGVADPGETGAAFRPVYVDLNDNTYHDPGEPAAVTDAAGAYSINTPTEGGTFAVRLAESDIWGPTAPASGARTITITHPLQQIPGVDFLASDRSVFTGRIFEDLDGDGAQGPGEAPLAGWVVFADLNHNNRQDAAESGQYSATSDASGVYVLNLPGAGPDASHRHYHFVQPRPPGWHRTTPAFTDLVTVITRPGRVYANLDYGSRRHAAVTGRHVFYNASAFDNFDPAPGSADDAAIAPDKQPLLPGVAATPAHFTTYQRGLNGIMVDLAGTWSPPTAADFAFKAGLSGDPSTWPDAPAPVVTIRPGAGGDGSDRVTLTWPESAPRNTWLQVTVKANANTGLAHPDVFTFGNLPGDTGNAAPGATAAKVDAADVLAVSRAPRTAAPITHPLDFNRDGRINVIDNAIARSNYGASLPLPAGATSMLASASGPFEPSRPRYLPSRLIRTLPTAR